MPASVRAGLAALVLAATGALTGARGTDTARAQTETVPAPDQAPKMVAPEELEDELADPNREPPRADDQGRSDSRAGARKGGVHVVRSGDTLWGIARSNLGGSPTNAQLAGEVQRLWDLNGVKIGTGTPDLIYAGQRLKLR